MNQSQHGHKYGDKISRLANSKSFIDSENLRSKFIIQLYFMALHSGISILLGSFNYKNRESGLPTIVVNNNFDSRQLWSFEDFHNLLS